MMFTKAENLSRGGVCVQTVDSDVLYYCFNSSKLFKKIMCGLCVYIRWDAGFCESFSTDLHASGMIYHLI
jgi:hypothetical protein